MRHLTLLPLLFAMVLTTPGCPGGQGGGEAASPAPVASSATYQVEFETTKGKVVLEVHPDWSPRGEARFRELVESGYFNGCSFFRVVSGFVAQFGISGTPALNESWSGRTIDDDPVRETNSRGTLTFAKTSSADSRTTQLFFNLADNGGLDRMGFAPFAKVVSGMDVIESLYSGYGDGAPRGKGPDQGRLTSEGDAYLSAEFPKLDKILTAKVVSAGQ